MMKLFWQGFMQVFFVAVSTFFIAHKMYIGAFLSGFVISWLWTINVRRIVAASLSERFVYAFGAASGSITGIFFAQYWI